jgi:hypothetical protein
MNGPHGNETKVKHLEFLQAIIARLANNSCLLKGWTVTLAGAFFGFAVANSNWQIAAIGLLPIIAFWGLDAYFLRQERLFRCLYDDVRRSDSEVEPFSMNVTGYRTVARPWWRTLFSNTLLAFYAVILLVGLILTLAVALHEPSSKQASRTKSATSSFTSSPQGSLGGHRFRI